MLQSGIMTAKDVTTALAAHANPHDAAFLQQFFKTGKGQYGEGDVFIGVRVPQTRAVCKQFIELPLAEVQRLLDSNVHEHRLAGALLLTYQYARADNAAQEAIYEFYLSNVRKGRINNWDIVDISADRIVGAYLRDRPRDILFTLARSNDIWQRRVSIVASFWFVKQGDPSTTFELAELLLHDRHDLIQKAVGWMLREIGKKVDRRLLLSFLDTHAHHMPRTTLRYAIEHLPPEQKQYYMQLKRKANARD